MIEIQGVDPKMIAGDVESAYPTHPGSILNNCPPKSFVSNFLGAVYSGGFRLLHDVKPPGRKDRYNPRNDGFERTISIYLRVVPHDGRIRCLYRPRLGQNGFVETIPGIWPVRRIGGLQRSGCVSPHDSVGIKSVV